MNTWDFSVSSKTYPCICFQWPSNKNLMTQLVKYFTLVSWRLIVHGKGKRREIKKSWIYWLLHVLTNWLNLLLVYKCYKNYETKIQLQLISPQLRYSSVIESKCFVPIEVQLYVSFRIYALGSKWCGYLKFHNLQVVGSTYNQGITQYL